ncbi:hypothetical protein [Pseudoalteromonas phage XCL1123]|nr:hypothetical protein [Pseudoalteromonas phage XCL1123]
MNKENEAGHNLVFAASECKEWPCVNDEVVATHASGQALNGEVLAKTKEYIIIQQKGFEQHLHIKAWEFSKPKTPEEALRDEVTEVIWKANEQWGNSKGERQISVQEFVAIALLTKYSITPKD